jgi:RNA polymerase sigma-70 factor (ECF subfamily)
VKTLTASFPLEATVPWSRADARPGAAEPTPLPGEETRWIRRASAGDPDAFRELVDRYRDRAYEVALRIVRNAQEAEEVTQDAFVRAWRALEGFRGEARFSTWLYRIVTRCALDAAERNRRRATHETGLEPEMMETVAADVPAAEPHLVGLDRLLGELAPVPRAVVTLFYLRERRIEEIAAILDLPPGTVKTHLHRSRAQLRRGWQRLEARDGLR